METVLLSNDSETMDVYDTCIKLAQQILSAGWFETASDVFSPIESYAQDTFGSDHVRTIALLEKISVLYQGQGRWSDAAPRFEQALAACLSRYRVENPIIKRLETALENKHYEKGTSLEKDLGLSLEASTCRKIRMPGLVFHCPETNWALNQQ